MTAKTDISRRTEHLPLSSLPGFRPLPSNPALLTDEDVSAICGGDIDGALRDLIRLVRQRQSKLTAQTITEPAAATKED